MSVKIMAASQSWDYKTNTTRHSEKWIGSNAEIDALRQSLRIGVPVPGKGNVDSVVKGSDAQSALQTLSVSYKTQTIPGGSQQYDPATARGPYIHSLNTVKLQLHHSKLENYLTYWDHYLIRLGDSVGLPDWAMTARDTNIPYEELANYRWIKQLSERPQKPTDGKYWNVILQRTKPGEYVDWETYEITEYGKHTTEDAAAWAVAVGINRIFTVPLLGDFGLSEIYPSRNWKLEDAPIRFDGKYWLATRRYLMSGDWLGWDQEYYGPPV